MIKENLEALPPSYRVVNRIANLEYIKRITVKYNKEHEKERVKKHREIPEIKQRIQETKREYYHNNKEYIKKRNKNYLKTPEGRKTRHKGDFNRIARLNDVVHDLTYSEWREKLLETKGICPDCEKYIGIDKLTLDHILPICMAPEGYVYTINDVMPLCRSCNSSKGFHIYYGENDRENSVGKS